MIVRNDSWEIRYSLYYDVSLNRTQSADMMFRISIMMIFEMFKDRSYYVEKELNVVISFIFKDQHALKTIFSYIYYY